MRLARARALAGMVLPPIIPKAVARVQSAIRRDPGRPLSLDFRPEWEFLQQQWPCSDPRGAGWLSPSIIETQRRRWPIYSELIRGKGPLGFHLFTTGAISVANESAHNVFMTSAYVFARAALGQSRISVLDWGGGVGYYALIAQTLLPEVTLDYVIKELPGLVELGRELMPAARFEQDEAACLSRSYDLVLASSSIQYSEDWRSLVASLARAADRWLFISRVPIARRAKSFVVVQRPHHYGYRTEYISWVLNRDELLAHFADIGMTLEREFLAGGISHIRKAPDTIETLGFLCRKQHPGRHGEKPWPPTTHQC
jgi:putative methyltransferase (TIGR04325 family)